MDYKLRIAATTDLHGKMRSFDYFSNKPTVQTGFDRLATLIAQSRAECRNHILIDNGDIWQGDPFVDDAKGRELMCDAFDALKYDALNLGNHDFNHGIAELNRLIARLETPVLNANVKPLKKVIRTVPYILKKSEFADGQGLLVGILGVCPEHIMSWDHQNLYGNVTCSPMLPTIETTAATLRQHGADIIVGAVHSGQSDALFDLESENIGNRLGASGVDAIILGHQHDVLADHLRNQMKGPEIPRVMAGYGGSHLGIIDLTLSRQTSGWHIVNSRVETRATFDFNGHKKPTSCVVPSPWILKKSQDHHIKTRRKLAESVGISNFDLNSYFSLVAPTTLGKVTAAAMLKTIKTTTLPTELRNLPVLGATNVSRNGGLDGPKNFTAISKGPLTVGQMLSAFAHEDKFVLLKTTGAQLTNWLEKSACVFNQIQPFARDATLLDPTWVAQDFDVFYGATYEIDLSKPKRFDRSGVLKNAAGRRIRDLKIGGIEVAQTDQVLVVVNAFRGFGGGNCDGTGPDHVAWQSDKTVKEVFQNYLIEQTDEPDFETPFRFREMHGTTAIFKSGTSGRNKRPSNAIEYLGPTRDMFGLYRLHLSGDSLAKP